MSKTLQKLIMDELGSEDPDKAEALADVVLDWLERTERSGFVAMASGWRGAVEENRRAENQSGQGR